MSAIQYHSLQVSDIITSEDVRSYKPRPEMFVEGLKRANLKSSEVLHVGDSIISDVQGARNLGMRVAWMNRINKTRPDHIQPDFIFKSFDELRTIL